MDYTNRIVRLSKTLTLLSKNLSISTPQMVELFNVSKKIVQTDMKEYLLKLFHDDMIYYDYSSKSYKAKTNFLTRTLLSAQELAVIAILKSKSSDKYSDDDLLQKTEAIFLKLEEELSNTLYAKSHIEKIDDFKSEIIQIKNAIESKSIIRCKYKEKLRTIFPLKILNLEGFWYLILYEPSDNRIKTFHLNSLKDIYITTQIYSYDKDIIKNFDNALNAYYKPLNKPITVQLFASSEISRFFTRKPLNPTQRVLQEYDDGSIDFELIVTDLMEVIPIIQRYMPHLHVIEPEQLKEKIVQNIQIFLNYQTK